MDFFAGTGYDKDGNPGSPIRLLRQIDNFFDNCIEKGTKIRLHLNEFDPEKFKSLNDAFEEWRAQHPRINRIVEIIPHNKDFKQLFPILKTEIQQNPSLVYLDQNGVKFIGSKYLLEFEKMKATDFLAFTSSSFLYRLGDQDEFQKHVRINLARLRESGYSHTHRMLCTQLKELLPGNTDLKLYPFSIKKKGQIYGIIFGSSHPRGVDKFLNLAWKENAINGEANFDMDEDLQKSQLSFFEDKKLTKIQSFEKNVEHAVLAKKIRNNRTLLEFAFENGHKGTHAAKVLRELKKQGKITYEGKSPRVTYKAVYKDQYVVRYEVMK